MSVTIIAALAENNCIGDHGTLPWHLPDDLRFFKEQTLGKIVIMGRKTWESIPEKFRPLPGRTNVVITRQPGYIVPEGVAVFSSLDDALEAYRHENVMIAGGAEIYRAALPIAHTLLITHVPKRVAGDAFFPVIDQKHWEITSERRGEYCRWTTYTRSSSVV